MYYNSNNKNIYGWATGYNELKGRRQNIEDNQYLMEYGVDFVCKIEKKNYVRSQRETN
jgi:hypothetical protein